MPAYGSEMDLFTVMVALLAPAYLSQWDAVPEGREPPEWAAIPLQADRPWLYHGDWAITRPAGKWFASAYALYSGVALLTSVGVIFAPALHRLLHAFHIEADEEERGPRSRRP